MTEAPEHRRIMARIDSNESDRDLAILKYRQAVDRKETPEVLNKLKAHIERLATENEELQSQLAQFLIS